MTDLCALCNSADTVVAVQLDGRNILRCNTCSVLFQQPPATNNEEMAKVWNDYAEHYYRMRKKTYARVLEKIQPSGNRRLLDVGCALGWFMGMAVASGFEAWGIEPSEDQSRKAHEYSARPVQIALIENAPYPDQFFQVVTLFDVLEHILDPIACLREVKRVLADNGFLVIRVPDQDGLLPTVGHWLHLISLGRYSEPVHLLWQFHRWGFNGQSLNYLLDSLGLRIVEQYGEDSQDIANLELKRWARSKIVVLGVAGIVYLSRLFNRRDEMVVIAQKKSSQEA